MFCSFGAVVVLCYCLVGCIGTLGNSACNIYLYPNWVFACAICWAHMLIDTNRMWAISRPISYRTTHLVRKAVILCLAMWVFVHGTPVIVDARFFRLPEKTNGCMINVPEQVVCLVWIRLSTGCHRRSWWRPSPLRCSSRRLATGRN